MWTARSQSLVQPYLTFTFFPEFWKDSFFYYHYFNIIINLMSNDIKSIKFNSIRIFFNYRFNEWGNLVLTPWWLSTTWSHLFECEHECVKVWKSVAPKHRKVCESVQVKAWVWENKGVCGSGRVGMFPCLFLLFFFLFILLVSLCLFFWFLYFCFSSLYCFCICLYIISFLFKICE